MNSYNLGSMVDGGAPCSAISSTELQLLRDSRSIDLDPLPD